MATKYIFQNVLVANTRLNLHMNQTDKRPQILVLNNKLNKCQAPANCATCCLQIEAPEFRRRSSFMDTNTVECFAHCSERKAINIEVMAKAQLGGKLVILALTRTENLLNEQMSSNESDISYRCNTETTWSFQRFEPAGLSFIENKLQAFYSHLSPNQLPSMMISSLNIQRNHTNHIDYVSLAIQSNKHRKHHEIVSKETLLVTELDCRLVYSNLSSIEIKPMGKVHLLALINREGKPTAKETDKVRAKSREELIRNPETLSTTLGDHQNKRAIQLDSTNSNLDPSFSWQPAEQPFIEHRIDTSNLLSPQLISQHRFNSQLANNSRFAQNHLTEIDSIRLRLRSNSLLMLTVSSSFVILTYTLCLFVYLKSRHKFRHKNTKIGQNNYSTPINLSPKKNNQKVSQVHEISPPFNLCMPPETQVRLETMLNSVHNKQKVGIAKDKPRKGKRNGKLKSKVQLGENSQQMPNLHPNEADIYSSNDTFNSSNSQSYVSYTNHSPTYLSYGTLNLVRAIRQATTLAKSRLRNSHYKPNLNAIPESELEYMQCTPREEVDLYASFLNLENQFEGLIQDAMSQECSHIVDRINDIDQTSTLFSKPIDGPESDYPISRKGILKVVAQERLDTKQEIKDNELQV